MSRMLWVAVGAAGGIYAYRRGQRALDEAKARGFVGNVQVAAGTAANVASGVSKVAALAAGQPATPVIVDYDSFAALPEDVQVTPVRRTSLARRQKRVPATAMRLSALNPDAVVDIRELHSKAV